MNDSSSSTDPAAKTQDYTQDYAAASIDQVRAYIERKDNAELIAGWRVLEPEVRSGGMLLDEALALLEMAACAVYMPGTPEHRQAEAEWLPHRQRWYARTGAPRRTVAQPKGQRPTASTRPKGTRREHRTRTAKIGGGQDPGGSGDDPDPVARRVAGLVDEAPALSSGQAALLARLLGGAR